MTKQSTVILVSPLPAEADIFREVLQKEGSSELCWFRRRPALNRLKTGGRIRAMVADLSLFTQLRISRSWSRKPRLPIVVIPSMFDWKAMIQCLNRGVVDFLHRPLKHNEILPTLLLAERLAGGLGSAGTASSLRARLDGPGRIKIRAPSCDEQVTRISRFFDVLTEFVLPEPVRMDVRLGIEEMARNAVEWGNRRNAKKFFYVDFRKEEDRVTITVRDQGGGFDYQKILRDQTDPFTLAEQRRTRGKRSGGLGLKLVRGVMDEMHFNPKGDRIVMVKHLPPCP